MCEDDINGVASRYRATKLAASNAIATAVRCLVAWFISAYGMKEAVVIQD